MKIIAFILALSASSLYASSDFDLKCTTVLPDTDSGTTELIIYAQDNFCSSSRAVTTINSVFRNNWRDVLMTGKKQLKSNGTQYTISERNQWTLSFFINYTYGSGEYEADEIVKAEGTYKIPGGTPHKIQLECKVNPVIIDCNEDR